MRHSRSARLGALVLCVQLGALTAGCAILGLGEKVEFHCPQPTPAGLAIAVGDRANSPAPTLPAEVRKLITEATRGCAKITVIRVDGRPGVVDGPLVFTSVAKTQQNLDLEVSDFLKKVLQRLADAKARVAEADVLGALSVAAGAAGPGGTVALIDSGVQTTAPLDLRKDTLLNKKPQAIAAALQRGGLLPDLTNRKVILVGLGYTAAPQDALDNSSRTFLVDMWSEIVRTAAGGQNPVLSSEPNTNAAAVTSPAVSVVHFPVGVIHLECGALSVLPDDGAVGFVPDKDVFKKPDAARAVLRGFVDFLNQNPDAKVEIQGFIAHYSAGDLAQRRADRVKQELISLNVRNPIEAKGIGWGPFPTSDAPPDPRYDQLNRRVTIQVTCP